MQANMNKSFASSQQQHPASLCDINWEIQPGDEASCTSADAAALLLHDPRCVKTQSGLKRFAAPPGIQISSGGCYAGHSFFILLRMQTLNLWIKLKKGGGAVST